MADKTNHEPARDPQDLERFLVVRQNAGDVEGMLALFEPDAVVDTADGRITRGTEAIRKLYIELWPQGENSPWANSGRP